MRPDRSGAFNACKVAPKVMIRALTPFAPVRTTDSTGVPSGRLPNGSRRAVAAFADAAIDPADTTATIPLLNAFIIYPLT
jgi:hypothetical protein